MTTSVEKPRPFEPGTLGWTIDDLEDPAIERRWLSGRYEIVDGVLTKMPAAYFPSGECAFNLMHLVRNYLDAQGRPGRIAFEVDVVLRKDRVARADAVLLTPADDRRQEAARLRLKKRDPLRTRILIAPTLIVESISPDHEHHDAQTKRRWYAEGGVSHYWIVNAYTRTLECLVLDGVDYRLDASGRNKAKVEPSAFPGLVLPLADVWHKT